MKNYTFNYTAKVHGKYTLAAKSEEEAKKTFFKLFNSIEEGELVSWELEKICKNVETSLTEKNLKT